MATEAIQCLIMTAQQGVPVQFDSYEALAAQCLSEGIGEIIVTGSHVLKGYYQGHGDEMHKIHIKNGAIWHRTGDLGRFDTQGRLWLVGRAQGAISDARGTLYPFSVECALNSAFGIEKSAILAHRGKRVLVVEQGQKVPKDILEKLSWANIDQIHLTKKLPMDKRHNAKIDYPALRVLLEKEIL